MIWAATVYLEKHGNKTEEEVAKMPYPKFRMYINYYTAKTLEEFFAMYRGQKSVDELNTQLERIAKQNKALEK